MIIWNNISLVEENGQLLESQCLRNTKCMWVFWSTSFALYFEYNKTCIVKFPLYIVDVSLMNGELKKKVAPNYFNLTLRVAEEYAVNSTRWFSWTESVCSVVPNLYSFSSSKNLSWFKEWLPCTDHQGSQHTNTNWTALQK